MLWLCKIFLELLFQKSSLSGFISLNNKSVSLLSGPTFSLFSISITHFDLLPYLSFFIPNGLFLKTKTKPQTPFCHTQRFALFHIHPNILQAFLTEESIKYLQQHYAKILNKEIASQGNGTTLKLISYSSISQSHYYIVFFKSLNNFHCFPWSSFHLIPILKHSTLNTALYSQSKYSEVTLLCS